MVFWSVNLIMSDTLTFSDSESVVDVVNNKPGPSQPAKRHVNKDA